jgi:hypothetical protein
MCRGGGGYLFLPGFSDAIHGWMTGRMDGKSFTTTTSFIICNKTKMGMSHAGLAIYIKKYLKAKEEL